MKTRPLLLCVLAAAAVALAGCGEPEATPGSVAEWRLHNKALWMSLGKSMRLKGCVPRDKALLGSASVTDFLINVRSPERRIIGGPVWKTAIDRHNGLRGATRGYFNDERQQRTVLSLLVRMQTNQTIDPGAARDVICP